ncbi:uncharacterized protein MKK02DRAFT_32951 [Dioszegia hungarica]|uniref:Uncharacterized protein n=1 Tax=Dioszegia hungarica TaxID=4972 RepID=A0AA38HAH1_9TREE|nr:uncharacterized protein MKK02DRAFT_32951 [Dioszegia hungarica]KAI9635561.1 hypothetical protein MKK02DRAFT_32951 [Dioszegia hungarica]
MICCLQSCEVDWLSFAFVTSQYLLVRPNATQLYSTFGRRSAKSTDNQPRPNLEALSRPKPPIVITSFLLLGPVERLYFTKQKIHLIARDCPSRIHTRIYNARAQARQIGGKGGEVDGRSTIHIILALPHPPSSTHIIIATDLPFHRIPFGTAGLGDTNHNDRGSSIYCENPESEVSNIREHVSGSAGSLTPTPLPSSSSLIGPVSLRSILLVHHNSAATAHLLTDIMSSPSSPAETSPSLRAIALHPGSSRPFAKKTKSKSLSLPPFPRQLALAGPSSPPNRRQSSRADSTSSAMSSRDPYSAAILSPSNLPPTESMSYFPPFEDMGSDEPSPSAEEEEMCVAGPSRSSSPTMDARGAHGKNKSLGSLANFMAWATFSPTTESAPCRPSLAASQSAGLIPSASQQTDGERVEALTKRFTPAQGKRRVLEPMAVDEGNRGVTLLGLTTTGSMSEVDRAVPKQKKRMGSEIDVERMIRAVKEDATGSRLGEDEEGAVERILGFTPLRPRVQRQHLSLPPPSLHLPNWRFPIPSPPITSLSPHIPLEYFQIEISNPASTSTSPSKPSSAFSDLHELELDEIEGSLMSTDLTDSSSGSGSLSSGDSVRSHPVTPDRSPPRKTVRQPDPRFWTPSPQSAYSFRKSKGRFRVGDDEDEEDIETRGERLEMMLPEKLKLRRTSSSGSKASCDSNATIKAKEAGDITPRAGRGWKAVQAG